MHYGREVQKTLGKTWLKESFCGKKGNSLNFYAYGIHYGPREPIYPCSKTWLYESFVGYELGSGFNYLCFWQEVWTKNLDEKFRAKLS
jgi:hypothetical protein